MAAESSNLLLIARELLANPSHEGLQILLNHLGSGQESAEFQPALALFNYCATNFANLLTLKLLKVYQCSSSVVVRVQSIYLLAETLAEFRNLRFELSLVALHEIKPVLISCLEMDETEETEIRILSRIVSFVAYDVLSLDNNGWDELSDCILSLANTDPPKAFHVFIDLPPLYGKFIYRFMQQILEKAEKLLLNPEEDRVEDWSLALETAVKMGIQLLDSELRLGLVKKLLSVLEKSARELVEKGMEQFLLRGLENLERFLSRDKNLYNYNELQCNFVSSFMFKIRELGAHTKEATKKIHRLIKPSNDPQQEQPQEEEDRLKTLSPLGILTMFASNEVEERYREIAIRRLNLILSDHTSRKEVMKISEMRKLQPLLVSCLSKEGITESMFKVLGEVVYHVAYEMMTIRVEVWYGLREYIESKSETEFERAVYIFQCLTMWLEDDEFLIPVMKSLLPEIFKRLEPPRELLVDNSCWVLTFVGVFCAIVHLVGITSHGEDVKVIEDKMVDAVRELVERGMEVGLVRRAFRDVESIVKKQKEWFGMSELKLLKGLVRRLYEIKGMKMESKVVLWRINVFVGRDVTELAKTVPDSEVGSMNEPELEED